MKNNLIILVALLLGATLNAQVQTLAGSNFTSGGYGGPVSKVGAFKGKTCLLSGGRGAWIINHKFAIGGGSYNMLDDIKSDITGNNGNPLYTDLNYGGFEFEYIHNYDKLVHWTIHTMFGGGTVKLSEHNPTVTVDNDKIFIVEPSLNLDINISNWFRIGFGASYRMAMGLDMTEISNRDISSFSGLIIFKFGKF